MKRRTFLKTAAAGAAAAPIMVGGLPLRANTTLGALAQLPTDNDRILVVIQLFGGNDGLNMVIPALDDEYYKLRPKIAVQKEYAWNNIGDIFLHPNFAKGDKGGMARMLEIGTLSIVQGVGYPNPNLSHFRSTDIWLSGINNSDPNTRLETGWIGRYLEKKYPSFPASLPDHPLAIQFGGFSLALLSSKGRMGIEVINPDQLQGVASQLDELDPESAGTAYYDEYRFVADIANRSNKYAQAVREAYNAGKTQIQGKYNDDVLAKQLGSVAALIAGGLTSKVYIVSRGGFDTHVQQQVDMGNGDYVGTHPYLLERMSDAVSQFMFDMTRLGQADRVMGMTVSEFGRRPHENGSFGTDHGAASVQLVFGTQVNSGVFGDPPDLKNLNANGDLQFQIDYRTVYAEVLTDWFGMPLNEARTVLQDETLIPLDILKAQISGSDRNRTTETGVAILGSYPNPFSTSTLLRFSIDRETDVRLDLTSVTGERVAALVNRRLAAGVHEIPLSLDLPPGVYLCALRAGSRTATYAIHRM